VKTDNTFEEISFSKRDFLVNFHLFYMRLGKFFIGFLILIYNYSSTLISKKTPSIISFPLKNNLLYRSLAKSLHP